MTPPPLPEDSGRPDGDGWIVGLRPPARRRPVSRPAWQPSRRLFLATAIVAVALLVLIAAAPAAAALLTGGTP